MSLGDYVEAVATMLGTLGVAGPAGILARTLRLRGKTKRNRSAWRDLDDLCLSDNLG
jgi:hypothetical protein